jgi:hypothetical protein
MDSEPTDRRRDRPPQGEISPLDRGKVVRRRIVTTRSRSAPVRRELAALLQALSGMVPSPASMVSPPPRDLLDQPQELPDPGRVEELRGEDDQAIDEVLAEERRNGATTPQLAELEACLRSAVALPAQAPERQAPQRPLHPTAVLKNEAAVQRSLGDALRLVERCILTAAPPHLLSPVVRAALGGEGYPASSAAFWTAREAALHTLKTKRLGAAVVEADGVWQPDREPPLVRAVVSAQVGLVTDIIARVVVFDVLTFLVGTKPSLFAELRVDLATLKINAATVDGIAAFYGVLRFASAEVRYDPAAAEKAQAKLQAGPRKSAGKQVSPR